MPRNLSTNALQAVLAPQTTQIFLELFTFDPDSEILDSPIRFARNTADVVSRSNTFTAIQFEIRPPSDTSQKLPTVRLSFDNIDRTLIEFIRSNQFLGDAIFEIVLASSPDTLEYGPARFTVLGAQFDAMNVEIELGFEDLLAQRYPKDLMTPETLPALFR